MEQNRSALFLRDMFPSMPDEIILATLDAHENNVEEAIGALLEMCAGESTTPTSALTAATGGSARIEQHYQSLTVQLNGKNDVRLNVTASTGSGKQQTASSTRPGRKPAPDSRPHNSGSGRSVRAPPPTRTTWGQLRSEHQLQAQVQQQQHTSGGPRPNAPWAPGQLTQSSCQSPKYVAPGAAASVRLGAADFPGLPPANGGTSTAAGTHPTAAVACSRGSRPTSLAAAAPKPLPVGRSSSTMATSYSAGSLQGLVETVGSLSFTSETGSGRGAIAAAATMPSPSPPWPHASLPFGYADVARYVAQQPAQPEDSWPHTVAQGDAYGAGGDAAVDEGWQAAALEELYRSHPWAGRDLVEAVCLALQYDLAEVVAALDELNAASYQYDGGGGGSGSPAASSVSYSAASSSDDDEWGEKDADDSRQKQLPARHGTAIAAVPYDLPAQRGFPGARQGAAGGTAGGIGGGGCRRRGKAEESLGSGDAYSRHRRSALKLTHAWRKHMNKASAAFAAGDRALGRRLVAEAQELRRRAAEAHQEAAERIAAEMNQGRQLSEWELDLHGLHVNEAVQVMAKRIASLESVAAAAGRAAAADTGARATLRRRPGGGGDAAAPAASPPALAAAEAAAASAAAKLLASRRVLRVIVGKGIHSSGGEASLPRAIEGYLLESGYRFTRYAGVIEVQLRRSYAIKPQPPSAAAAGMTVGAGAGPLHRRPR